MDKSTQELISNLDETLAKKALSTIIDKIPTTEDVFFEFIIKNKHQEALKYSEEKMWALWNQAKDEIESFDDSDYGYYDYRQDDHVDIDGNALRNYVNEIEVEIKSITNKMDILDLSNIPYQNKKKLWEEGISLIHNCNNGEFRSAYWGPFIFKLLLETCTSNEEYISLANMGKGISEIKDLVVDTTINHGDKIEGLREKALFSYSYTSTLSSILEIENLGRKDIAIETAKEVLITKSIDDEKLSQYVIDSFAGSNDNLKRYLLRKKYLSDWPRSFLILCYNQLSSSNDKITLKMIALAMLYGNQNDVNKTLYWWREFENHADSEEITNKVNELKEKYINNRKNPDIYVSALYLQGNYKEAFDVVKESEMNIGWIKLLSEYLAEESIKRCYELAEKYTIQGKNGSYYLASAYLSLAKSISSKNNNLDDFNVYFNSYLKKHRNKRLLLQKLRANNLIS